MGMGPPPLARSLVRARRLRPPSAASISAQELRDVVWRSYGEMPRRGIQAIPLFVFNCLELGVIGGPLRPDEPGEPTPPPIVNGSMQARLPD